MIPFKYIIRLKKAVFPNNKFSNTFCKNHFNTAASRIHVCIIGSGPAGFYTAQALLKNSRIKVDIYEKLPVPFGLVRFGVSPDHPEVKNCITSFTNTASNQNCKFIGNVNIGKDISVAELQQAYHAIVLSYGADNDQVLSIPGEKTRNVVAARHFVGWYNGLPSDRELSINLDVETAVVIGVGNVALDVARILLSPVDRLKGTDITEYAMEKLTKSKVRRVILVGRRGPLQVSFTIKELREMTKLPGCVPILAHEDFKDFENILPSLPRPRKRITELMIQTSKQVKSANPDEKEWELRLLRTPLEILVSADGSNDVEGIVLGINKLSDQTLDAKVSGTEQKETIKCGLILRSIGYKSWQLDPAIPYDERQGLIPNVQGRVTDAQGMYCSGWVKTGPVGVILNTMNSAFETAATLLRDLEGGCLAHDAKLGFETIQPVLHDRGVRFVSFDAWQKINKWEVNQGKKLGKNRLKIVDIEEMLRIAADA